MVHSGLTRKITDIFKSKARTLSAELIPPRNGTETDVVLSQIQALKSVPVDFLSVTKGAGGSLRGGTLPIAHLIQAQHGIASLAHFTCRDYTCEEIENALMDHHYFGVNNILALRGDPPDGRPDWFKPAPNRYEYAYKLVEQIRKLNAGEYLHRPGYDKEGVKKTGQATEFCIGVAAHPELAPFEKAVEHFAMKVDAGATFAITQMIFNAEPYARFVEACAKRGIDVPILPGIFIQKKKEAAIQMAKRFGVSIPEAFLEKLGQAKSAGDAQKIGLEYTEKLCHEFFKLGAKGVHVFVMNDAETGAELLRRLK